MKTRLMFVSACVLSLLAGGALAAPQTATATMNVTGTVHGTCQLDSITPMAFGDMYFGDTEKTATSTVTVSCNNGLPFKIYAAADRVMTDGSITLPYELYTEVTHTTVLGTTAAGNVISGTGAGMAPGEEVLETIYGRVAGANIDTAVGALTAASASLTDTVVVTVEFN